MPLVSPLALGALPALRRLPRGWIIFLSVFVLLQLVAAALTPEPLLSLPLALLRAGYTVALIVMGYLLGHPNALRPALIGYGVVAVTAFVTTLSTYGHGALGERLVHPYYTSVSLGLAGTLGLLLAVTWKGGPWGWRVLGGGLSLGLFLWSGSRGPLIALVAGLIAVLATNARLQWKATLLAVVAGGALVYAAQSTQLGSVTGRFMENTLNGRGTFWADALDTARAYPWGGVGPYQLGPHLSTQYHEGDTCNFWLKFQAYGLKGCPAFLNRFRGAWLIAHNTAFHLLGETGVIGLSGWLALMGALALAAWRSGDALLNALTWAIAAMGLVDNPTLLPNLGHAELYWLAGGVGVALSTRAAAGGTESSAEAITTAALRPAAWLSPVAPLLACLLLGYFTLPVWWEKVRPGPKAALPTLEALTLPSRLTAGENVTVFLKVRVPQGPYQLKGMACKVGDSCTLWFQVSLAPEVSSQWLPVGLKGLEKGRYQLRMILSSQRASLRVDRPLAQLVRVIDVE